MARAPARRSPRRCHGWTRLNPACSARGSRLKPGVAARAPLEASAIAGGVGAGSALWFALLARWIGRVRPDHPAVTAIPRVALVLLVAIAVVGVARVLWL